ncbi:hypothetical protein ACJX0J_020172, partial [Zea mays]
FTKQFKKTVAPESVILAGQYVLSVSIIFLVTMCFVFLILVMIENDGYTLDEYFSLLSPFLQLHIWIIHYNVVHEVNDEFLN